MESESSSSSLMRRVPLDGRQPVSKTGVAHKAKGSIPSPSSKFVQRLWRRWTAPGRNPGLAKACVGGSIPPRCTRSCRRDCNWQTYSAQTQVDGGSNPPAGTS